MFLCFSYIFLIHVAALLANKEECFSFGRVRHLGLTGSGF